MEQLGFWRRGFEAAVVLLGLAWVVFAHEEPLVMLVGLTPIAWISIELVRREMRGAGAR